MKKWLIFLIGLILGGLLFFILSMGFEGKSTDSNNESGVDSDTIVCIDGIEDYNSNDEPYTKTEEAGEIINEKSFKVFQVYNQIVALVHGKDEYGYYNGTVYLLEQSALDVGQKRATPFYDDLIIKVQKGQEVRMFGTHTYTTRSGNSKTVPVIRIMNK